MAGIVQNEDAAALKEQGNKSFADGDFEAADQHYSSAIALDPTQHALFSNRAAARLKLGNPQDALADANECIKLKPDWMKGYHRRALALKDLGDETGAYDTYCLAQEACKSDAWLDREAKRCQKDMWKAHKENDVAGADEMVSIFTHMEGTWDRLSTLAYFWNASSPEERKIIFGQFLVIMAGDGTPANIDEYELSQMVALPTENYEEANKFPIPVYMKYYESLAPDAKLDVFEKLWLATSDTEKKIIYKDLQFFFLQPLQDRQNGVVEAGDEDEEGEGGETESPVAEGE